MFLVLQPIGDFQRRPEDELLGEFGKDLPGILGGLLDAMAHGLKNLPNVVLERAPRMADFAKWACACEGCVWPAGTFLKAYDRNRATAVGSVIDADAVASAIRLLMSAQWEWIGTAAELLKILERVADEGTRKSRAWPSTHASLSNCLRRAKPMLRSIGIEIEMWRAGRDGTRMLRITGTPSSGADV